MQGFSYRALTTQQSSGRWEPSSSKWPCRPETWCKASLVSTTALEAIVYHASKEAGKRLMISYHNDMKYSLNKGNFGPRVVTLLWAAVLHIACCQSRGVTMLFSCHHPSQIQAGEIYYFLQKFSGQPLVLPRLLELLSWLHQTSLFCH